MEPITKRRAAAVTAAVAAVIIAIVWSFDPFSLGSVNAANEDAQGGATAEMLNYALNFKSASNLGVFGGTSVSDTGSEIRGVVGSAGEITGVASNALSVGDASETRRDLLDTFSYVDQLPCTQVNDAKLGGQSFGPGVYCVTNASLAGRMTVDAGGDANARFVFRVDGTFTAQDSASIEGAGAAQATNVYIFSKGSASVGNNAVIGSNVISRDSVRVGHGSTVSGKLIGVEGTVATDSNIIAAGTGYVEICKTIVANGIVPDPILPGTIFNFTVSGVNGTIQVPAGGCSPPIQVAAGNVTITEAARANTALLGFTVSPFNRTVSSSSTLQQLVVAVPAGDVNDQTVATFFNQTTRTGTIEICKFGLDSDVSGFFNYTVQGAPGQTFAVPVGFCSGPITVTIGLGLPNTPPIAHPGTNFVVNSIADTDDGVCDAANCTLREAINAANARAGADTITFGISGTILLGPTAAPLITDNLSIDGANRAVTIDGGGTIVPLNVGSNQTFNLNAVTVANGSSNAGGGLLAFAGSDVTITRCRFQNNQSAQGGAIFAAGQTMKIDSTTFAGNSSTALGGAIFNTGILTITNSLFTGNSSTLGGAIAATGTLSVTNSTFFNNTATAIGGGVYTVGGNATITNTTFSTNSAAVGGGAVFNSNITTLQNTLLTNSPTGGNCAGAPPLANSFNISDDASCGGATVRTAAQINLAAAPANNGGPTQTMALTLPSAAADTGDNSVCPLTDQRGAFRPANSTTAPTARCDVGAYEISTTTPFTANVTELAKDTYRLENVTTFPASALNSWTPDQGYDANGLPIVNTNGGFANVSLNVAGGAANQTTVRFFNRSLPGRIKVCKITADPVNIPVGTAFTFAIAGLAGPLPGTLVNFDTFDVLAGPAAQGGFCAFAPRTWVVSSNVLIFEIGISAANTTTLPLGLAATQAGLGTSRIQASTPFVTLPFTVPGNLSTFTENPGFGNALSFPFGVITARNATAEIEFTNYVYRPAILKLCKVAGAGVAVGTPFSFSIAPLDPLTTRPYPAGNITVPAGSCTFVNGPFLPNAQFPGVGLFNFGTSIVVTENAVPGIAVLGISSPTLTPVPNPNPPNFIGTLTADIANRRGTLTLNNILSITASNVTNYYFNELAFTNIAAVIAPPAKPARFDFDGDHASDIALFRPSDGNWYYNASGTGQVRAVHFGQAGDIPVAADYDGDGTTDVAVYRGGLWYVLGSTSGFSATSFGVASDIPQTGDFDGDGKADFAVYRQSNGVWYIMGSASGFRADQFGISTDIPVASDFDGDGKTDPAVYRSGTWYILGSTAGFSGVQFGIAGDKPVQADYDGDGRSDVAVYRGGTWYIMGSSTGFRAAQFGTSTDTPVPADYDGDGKADVGVYRSSTTVWYILNSSQSGNAVGGFSSMQFGQNGDVMMNY